MILKRGSVAGVLLLTLAFSGPARAQSQSQGMPARLAALQAQVDQAMATIAKLRAALLAEAALRESADAAIAGHGARGGGVTQAQLDAAIAAQSSAWSAKLAQVMEGQSSAWSAKLDGVIAAEAAARTAADTGLQGQIATEAGARNALELSVAPLFALTPLSRHVSVQTGPINGLAGPHVLFTGVNVHIRSGIGDSYTPNGRGNFIVGYNETPEAMPAERDGSHNVVVGGEHRYNFGTGLAVGYSNRLLGMGASISAGSRNEAGEFSSVSGGSRNLALGPFSSISGGDSNVAGGANAVVTAGLSNAANGDMSSVTGGTSNVAGAYLSTVTGGQGIVNSDQFSVKP